MNESKENPFQAVLGETDHMDFNAFLITNEQAIHKN